MVKLFDFHTQVRAHGKEKPWLIDETIDAAIKLGLSAICLTDHFPLPPGFADTTNDTRVTYPEYVEKILAAKKRYEGKIEVLLGAEFDWVPLSRDWIREQVQKYPFDYCIGSVHFICPMDKENIQENIPIDYTKETFAQGVEKYGGIQNITAMYHRLVQDVIESKLFDCIGHIDRIKDYTDPTILSEDNTWYKNETLLTLDVLAKAKIVMEINTSGFYHPCREQYPSKWIIKEAFQRGIPVTISSDAHHPEHIGRDLGKAVYLAKQAGYKSLYRFQNRKKIQIRI